MARAMSLNVRVSGGLSDFVATNIGDNGAYENVSEYVRDLIRRDMERVEQQRFEALRAELQAAFQAPEAPFARFDAAAFMSNVKRRAR